MKKIRNYVSKHRRPLLLAILALSVLGCLLVYRLGSLVGGLSAGEQIVASTPLGWHGIYHQPFYLPLEFVRSVVFFLTDHHGQTLTRLPNVVFGALAITTFALVLRLWHGGRTALFASVLFATSAWVLHVSRLASFDALYLWVVPTLLLVHAVLHRKKQLTLAWYGSLVAWGLLLYIPGIVWLVLLSMWWERGGIVQGWKHCTAWWQRLFYLMAGMIWLPLLAIHLTRPGVLHLWLGAPAHFSGLLHVVKQFAGVFVHLFIRGPQYPTLWLGRAPLLDIFTLSVCLLGIYFYCRNWRASRSRLLGSFFAISVVLIALGGPVSLSLLVPLLYLAAATGIAYLLREWLKVFPRNPLARGLGIGLVTLAVGLSCLYNLRAYFIAWPHNDTTQATFRNRR